MKKIILIIVMFLMCFQIVNAETAYSGEDYLITKETCYGNAHVKVTKEKNVTDYNIKDCIQDESIWVCECWGDYGINWFMLQTNNDTVNVYDIVIEYYTSPLLPVNNSNRTSPTENEIINDIYKKTLNFNNIKVKQKVVKEPFVMPKFSGGVIIFFVVFLIIIFIGFGGYFLIRYLFKSEDENEDEVKIKPKEKENIDNDEELKDLLKDL